MRVSCQFPILIILGMLLPFVSQAQEPTREFTTFENYAKMTKKQQGKIKAYAFKKLLEQANEQKDQKRYECMKASFSTKYGKEENVKRNFGLLNGQIDYAIKNPSPNGRVEYLVANYMIRLCPKSENLMNH